MSPAGKSLIAQARAGARRVATPLAAAFIAAVALGAIVCGSAEAQSKFPPAAVTNSVRVSDPSTGFVLNQDFARLFFVPSSVSPITSIGRTDKVYQGKLVQARAFMSATILYQGQPTPSVIDDAHYVGGDDSNPGGNDLVAMRCRPQDPDQLDAVLATWPKVFTAAASDLADLMQYTPADCPTPDLDPSYPVDQRVYCESQSFSDQANKLVPLSLQAAIDAGAAVFQLAGTPFPPTGSTTGANVLYDLYGIGSGFSGLGFSVQDSYRASKGGNVPLTAAQALEQSIVTEYLVRNVSLAAGNCRCVRVKPYDNRDQRALRWNAVWTNGRLDRTDFSCVERNRLP
ncbi:MAG TPA: hypothetical protein VNE82_23280 [Candidatus Binataceae bacterium]|nr:hypothetical protein [Candidatus Binataceae bacterium]